MGGHGRHFPRGLVAAFCGALLTLAPVGPADAATSEAPQEEAPQEVAAFGDATEVDVSFGGAPVDIEAVPGSDGYWLLNDSGEVGAYAGAVHHGDTTTLPRRPGADFVDLEPTPTGGGYWLLDTAGGVFTFGDARYHDSIPGLRNAGRTIGRVDAVNLEPTPSGDGYWILDAVGGVFTFGDARFFGSAADRPGRATGLAISGAGYWVSMVQGVDAPPLPANSGAGRRVVYCNSCQRVWLVETSGVIARSYQVSGRQGVPAPGHYSVFSKSRVSTDASGTLRLDYMTRFAHGRTLAIGFHGLPIDKSTGQPIQTLDELGEFRSAGCVRQAHADAAFLWDWAPVGTPVVVTA